MTSDNTDNDNTDSGGRRPRNRWVWYTAGGVGVIAVAAVVAFGYFGVHTLFVDDTVNDAIPTFEQPAATPPSTDTATTTDTTASEDTTGDTPLTGDATLPDGTVVTTEPGDATVPAPPTTTGGIVVEAAGTFAPQGGYDITGNAIVISNGGDQQFLRFENFEVDNGPDLNVYLFNPNNPDDYIDLGDLRGNIGDQNYELPQGIDLNTYSEVSIWCVRFSVGFGSAQLA